MQNKNASCKRKVLELTSNLTKLTNGKKILKGCMVNKKLALPKMKLAMTLGYHLLKDLCLLEQHIKGLERTITRNALIKSVGMCILIELETIMIRNGTLHTIFILERLMRQVVLKGLGRYRFLKVQLYQIQLLLALNDQRFFGYKSQYLSL